MQETVTLIAGAGALGVSISEELLKKNKGIVPVLASRRAAEYSIPGAATITADLLTPQGRKSLILAGKKLGPINRCFITMGSRLSKSLLDSTEEEAYQCVQTNLVVPLLMFKQILQLQRETNIPVHCVVITSTTALRIRNGLEAAYGAAKAGLAEAVLNTVHEWIAINPKGKLTHFLPGGMQSTFWPDDMDTSSFMNTDDVAARLVERVLEFESTPYNFDEWTLNRGLVPQAGRVLFSGIQFQPGVDPTF